MDLSGARSELIMLILNRSYEREIFFRDLVPIISALEYNTWFTKLRTSHIKLTHEAVERLLHVMKKSLSVEELYLDNLGFKWYVVHAANGD